MNQLFERTIADLEKVHPELLTGEGLSKLLLSCMGRNSKTRVESWIKYKEVLFPGVYCGLIGLEADPIYMEMGQRFMADPKGWISDDAPDGVKEGAEWYQGLSSLFQGSKSSGMSQAMAEIFFYHTIRDNVQNLQKSKGISSIKGKKTIELLNGSVEVYDFCDQLELVGDDEILMAQDARKVVDLFLTQMIQSNNYEYFDVTDENNQKETTIGAIFDYCQRHILEANIYTDCIKWIASPNGGWQSDGDTEHDPIKDPSTISLCLQTEDDSKSFEANHIDKSRFPWK